MNPTRFAFAGFRHGHIFELYKQVQEHPDTAIVAACEEDERSRNELSKAGQLAVSHDSIATMLDQVPCDVVATGDYYGRRGSILIEALKRGKHVISDKPICTSLDELDEIERLSRAKSRSVGCQLSMRDSPTFLTMRQLIRNGEIGDVHAIAATGQHPLLYGTRPGWYFEPGKHGGTINDIAIHAFDAIPWITGLRFAEVVSARTWNARLKQVPQFQDGAQFMLRMNNGCGVIGDVSYLAPDACGYRIPQYWRLTFWGEKGVVENNNAAQEVTLYRHDAKQHQVIQPAAAQKGGYLRAFLDELRGEAGKLHLTSGEVLRASRIALTVQQAADQNRCNVQLSG